MQRCTRNILLFCWVKEGSNSNSATSHLQSGRACVRFLNTHNVRLQYESTVARLGRKARFGKSFFVPNTKWQPFLPARRWSGRVEWCALFHTHMLDNKLHKLYTHFRSSSSRWVWLPGACVRHCTIPHFLFLLEILKLGDHQNNSLFCLLCSVKCFWLLAAQQQKREEELLLTEHSGSHAPPPHPIVLFDTTSIADNCNS